MKHLIYLFGILLLLSACIKTKKTNISEKEGVKVVDISNLTFNEGEMLLSDVADDIEIIPLETTENSILDFKKIRNIVIGKEDIFVNVVKRILRFNRNGKYIQDIGKFGQAPDDFLYSTGIGTDETAKTVYIASNMSIENKVKSYTYAGVYKKTIQAASEDVWLLGDVNNRESRDYCFLNGQHIFRRKLPLPDPSKENWQIMVKDTANNLITYIYDPQVSNYQDDFQQNSGSQMNEFRYYWCTFSPVLNCYDKQMNFLFEANDTIYRYDSSAHKLYPYYIFHTGNSLSSQEMYVMDKSTKYWNRVILLKDILESRDFIYIVAEKGRYSYLLRVDKETNEIQRKRREGEIKLAPIMQIHYREVPEPEFTNDLCGGLSFYPNHHNDKEWIGVYSPENLLEQINIDELKKSEVKLPDKKNQLIDYLQHAKEDDNPVLVIVKLK